MSRSRQPGAPAREPTRRLFFALWPDDAQRAALAHATRKAVRSSGGRPVPEHSLHVTLAFLGSVPERRVAELHVIARRVALGAAASGRPLLVSFDRLVHWTKARILCAQGGEAPAEAAEEAQQAQEAEQTDAPRPVDLTGAAAVAESLKSEIIAAGFSPDLKPFRAHVTVARKVVHARPAQPLPPFLWSFDAFALVDSRTEPTGPVYSVIESYLLSKAEKAHE